MRDTWSDVLVSSFRDVVERLAHVAPRLLAMVVVIVLGWRARRLQRAERPLEVADHQGP